jgi:type IX secretion system PorP/SprF family membrane protein
MKARVVILMVGVLTSGWVFGQSYRQLSTTDLYQYNYTTISPAFAGVDGEKMTFIGSVFVPKNGVYNGVGFLGYETPIKKIKSGIGFNASIDRQSIRSFSDLNVLYNYQWTISEQSKLVFGAKLTAAQFAIDVSDVTVFGGDPLLTVYQGANSASTFAAGAAVLFKHDKLFAGFSIDNVFHDTYRLYQINIFRGYYGPRYNLVVGRDFQVGKRCSTTHSVYIVNGGDFWRFDLNNSIVINDWLIGGLSLEVNNSDEDNQIFPKVNAGFRIRKKAQFMFSVYSEAYNMGSSKFRGQMLMLFNL